MFGRPLSWDNAFAVCIVHCSLVYQCEHSADLARYDKPGLNLALRNFLHDCYRSSPDRGLSVVEQTGGLFNNVLTDLMCYSTRHCTPSSSTSFFMFLHAVCCSSTSFTVKPASALLLSVSVIF